MYPRRNRADFSELNEPDSNDGDGQKIKVVGMIIFFRNPYLENVDDLMNPGKPLVYRIDSKSKQHWTLYSVGKNGIDDGGKIDWDGTRSKRAIDSSDLVWSMPTQCAPWVK